MRADDHLDFSVRVAKMEHVGGFYLASELSRNTRHRFNNKSGNQTINNCKDITLIQFYFSTQKRILLNIHGLFQKCAARQYGLRYDVSNRGYFFSRRECRPLPRYLYPSIPRR